MRRCAAKRCFWIWYGHCTQTFSVAAVTWTRLGLLIYEWTWIQGRLRRTHRSPQGTAGSQRLVGEEMPPLSPAVSPLKTSSCFGKELPTCAPGILIKPIGSHTRKQCESRRGAPGEERFQWNVERERGMGGEEMPKVHYTRSWGRQQIWKVKRFKKEITQCHERGTSKAMLAFISLADMCGLPSFPKCLCTQLSTSLRVP